MRMISKLVRIDIKISASPCDDSVVRIVEIAGIDVAGQEVSVTRLPLKDCERKTMKERQ